MIDVVLLFWKQVVCCVILFFFMFVYDFFRCCFIVGIVGYIDYGKMLFIVLLIGVDCDCWQEEKVCGIIIDLGFVYSVEDDLQIGFVDVLGYECFVYNVFVGLGGICLMMFVVVVDEGVKLQIVEYFDICLLFDILVGFVVLMKIDFVDLELFELVELEFEEVLQGMLFVGVLIVKVLNKMGEGIDDVCVKFVEFVDVVQFGVEFFDLLL